MNGAHHVTREEHLRDVDEEHHFRCAGRRAPKKGAHEFQQTFAPIN